MGTGTGTDPVLFPFHRNPGGSHVRLRIRVNQLGSLWSDRENRDRVQRTVETIVGFPVESCSQWGLVLTCVVGLWNGCIVLLLAACIGVFLGYYL